MSRRHGHSCRMVAAVVGAALASAACASSRPHPSCSRLPGAAVPVVPSIRHIPYPQASHVPYDSVPPTSGPHVPFTVAPGVYREQIADEIQVHALEHGHVLVQYAPNTASSVVDTLEDVARRFPRDVVLAPYDRLRSGIALTAWGRIERLSHPDTGRIDAFVTALAGRYAHGWRWDPGCP